MIAMKKVGIFVAILSAALLTGCGNNTSNNSGSVTGSGNSGDVTGSESVASSGNSGDIAGSESVASSGNSGNIAGSESVAEKKADFYAEVALNAVEFPKMTKVVEADEIDAFFEFNTANYADFSLYMNVMSVQLNRVFVVKPIDGKHDEVYSELEAYLDDLVRTGTYYPAQEASAMGSQMGETADGYIYIIVHEDGLTAVRAIENAVGG